MDENKLTLQAAFHRSMETGFGQGADDFIAGAEWERNRTKWVKVEDRLPDEEVEVLSDDGVNIFIDFLNKGSWVSGNDVTRWCYIPI